MEDDWRFEILSLLHDDKTTGHPGMSRIKLTVGSRFYWHHMRQDIKNWIKCCQACSMNRRGPR